MHTAFFMLGNKWIHFNFMLGPGPLRPLTYVSLESFISSSFSCHRIKISHGSMDNLMKLQVFLKEIRLHCTVHIIKGFWVGFETFCHLWHFSSNVFYCARTLRPRVMRVEILLLEIFCKPYHSCQKHYLRLSRSPGLVIEPDKHRSVITVNA